MITKLYNILCAGLLGCAAFAVTACTDTWDDHYNSLGSSDGDAVMHEGSLWQAIKSDPDLSNFAAVIEGCDYAKTLNSSQVFTVFAPTNDQLSQAEVQALIAEYKAEVANRVVEEDNVVLKEFIQNHMALYTHSVKREGSDSIVLMNGKYALLDYNTIDGKRILTRNQLYSNGILFKVAEQVSYLPNVFEYLRKDPELDSVRSFLYNGMFYRKEFIPELSVAGSIVNGKTQYLDSVFQTQNELFDYLGRLSTEDSSYIMVAPTNEVWKQLVEEYEPYFNYPKDVDKRDSLVYTNTRLAIMRGTTFSRTFNSEASLLDSAMSVNSTRNYSARRSEWGGVPFEYYQYIKPMEKPYGALAQAEMMTCSNGQFYKATQWNIDKRQTFNQFIILNANQSTNVKELSKLEDSHHELVPTISEVPCYVNSDYRNFYDRVWNNMFVEYRPNLTTPNHSVTYYLRDVLSNIGYDIYLVTVPALANDSNASEAVRVPTKLRITMTTPGKGSERMKTKDGSETFVTKADSIDYLLLAEDYKFDVCTAGVSEEPQQITLQVETRVSSAELRNGTYTRTMRINCVLIVPHGALQLVDALPEDESIPSYMWGTPGVLLYPHGQYADRPYKWWYMQR
ncbi:MAG: fasciclin domain-containing protein [Prevotella sp.]|nr:fasciclin domain-containing protein [Prevotella sp.]